MRPLPIKTHLLILSVSLIGAILLIVFFVMRPAMTRIREISRDIASKKEYVDLGQSQKRNSDRSLQELPRVTERVALLKTSALSRGQELGLITQLEALADANHLTQTLRIESNPTAYILSITTVGEFANHLRFLRALERLPYYVIIDKIEWFKRAAGNDTTVTARFNATIYASP